MHPWNDRSIFYPAKSRRAHVLHFVCKSDGSKKDGFRAWNWPDAQLQSEAVLSSFRQLCVLDEKEVRKMKLIKRRTKWPEGSVALLGVSPICWVITIFFKLRCQIPISDIHDWPPTSTALLWILEWVSVIWIWFARWLNRMPACWRVRVSGRKLASSLRRTG